MFSTFSGSSSSSDTGSRIVFQERPKQIEVDLSNQEEEKATAKAGAGDTGTRSLGTGEPKNKVTAGGNLVENEGEDGNENGIQNSQWHSRDVAASLHVQRPSHSNSKHDDDQEEDPAHLEKRDLDASKQERDELDKLRIQNTLLLQENSHLRSRMLKHYKRTSLQFLSGRRSLDSMSDDTTDHSAGRGNLQQNDLVMAWMQASNHILSSQVSAFKAEQQVTVRVVFDEVNVDPPLQLHNSCAGISQSDISNAWNQATVPILSSTISTMLKSKVRVKVKSMQTEEMIRQADVVDAWHQASLSILSKSTSIQANNEADAKFIMQENDGDTHLDCDLEDVDADVNCLIVDVATQYDDTVTSTSSASTFEVSLGQSDLIDAWKQASESIAYTYLQSSPDTREASVGSESIVKTDDARDDEKRVVVDRETMTDVHDIVQEALSSSSSSYASPGVATRSLSAPSKATMRSASIISNQTDETLASPLLAASAEAVDETSSPHLPSHVLAINVDRIGKLARTKLNSTTLEQTLHATRFTSTLDLQETQGVEEALMHIISTFLEWSVKRSEVGFEMKIQYCVGAEGREWIVMEPSLMAGNEHSNCTGDSSTRTETPDFSQEVPSVFLFA